MSHYKILRSLGAGAMGQVYAARDTLLGRTVAIKILQNAGTANEESRLRFLQEARAASALNHPGIITIYDIVRDGDVDCIVMELVTGETLAARIIRGRVPLEESLEIADRIADALAAAHTRGIVHRDLKPANVMLATDGRLKVLDFGLAKFLPAFEDTNVLPAMQTQSGVVVGTPCYMSPEQVLGKPLDGRSDIFSLGSITLEMISGRNPFESDSVIETMHRIAYDPLEASDLRDVPESVRGFIERMLAKQKTERFQTADEVRKAIGELRSGRPFTASRPSKRRQLAIGFAALSLITIGITASQLWRTREPPSSSPAPVRETFVPPRTAHDHVRRGNELLSAYWRKGYIAGAIEEFQRAIALDANYAAAHAGLSAAYRHRYDRESERTWLDLALKNARHAVELDPQLASARVALGAAEVSAGHVDDAREALEQTLIIDPANAAAHRWLSDVALREKDLKGAETRLRKALELQPENPDLYNVLGWFLYTAARYEESAAAFRRVIALAPDYVSAYRNLGAVLHMLGDYAGAARAFQQSLEIEPNSTAYSNLGTLYFFQGLYPQSVTAFEKAVELGANDHVLWANLGDAYRWTPDNGARAREAFKTALHLLDDEIRAHPDDLTFQSRRALYLAKQGDVREALSTANALMARDERDPQNLYRLALAFELAGARSRSLAALAQAIRGGYSIEEVKDDPELIALRRDVQYQRMMAANPMMQGGDK